MKILMVVAYFVPEIASAAHVYYDLARAFVRSGHEVHVITSYPREFNLCGDDVGKQFPLEEVIDGIEVHRCKHLARRDSIFLRGLEHFLMPRCYFRRYRRIRQQFDVCLVYIPPLPLYEFAHRVKRFDGTPSVLNYQDFHPQELVDVGVMKNRLAIKMMEKLESRSYRNADFITVLSKGGIDYILSRGGNPNRIRHIYNGISLNDLDCANLRGDFKEREHIGEVFLVSYAGILSPFQGVDNILAAAKTLTDKTDVLFYIVGDGMLRGHLEEEVTKDRISNVKLSPLLRREEYFNLVKSSDVSIVSLDSRMTAPCLPGKIISLMALGQPIIAVVPADSQTASLVMEAGCGFVVEPGKTEELLEAMMRLKANGSLRKTLGHNGRRFLEENMDLDEIAESYIGIFARLAQNRIVRMSDCPEVIADSSEVKL